MDLIHQLIFVKHQKQAQSAHLLHVQKKHTLEPLDDKELLLLIVRAPPSKETPTVCLKASVG